jgi:hypothetical protein
MYDDARTQAKIEAELRRRGVNIPEEPINGVDILVPLLNAALLVAVIAAIAWVTNWILGVADSARHDFPTAMATTKGALLCATIVLIAGGLFFWLRESRPGYYAMLEFTFAATTAFHASQQLGRQRNEVVWLLASVGAVYIVVRACDNMRKAVSPSRRTA